MNIRDDFILKNIHEGYLVGGAIRDFLMGKPFKDRDIAIKGADKFAKKLAKELDATLITLDEENMIYRVILKDKQNYLDISEIYGQNIIDDLCRRDFTINAIAYDLSDDTFIDVNGGEQDIKNGILHGIKEENFTDDPLRLLRAFRFAAVTGFEPDDELLNIITKHKHLIKSPAKERVHEEIMKLFGGKYAAKTLLKMYDIGFLELIFPCVKDMTKVTANSHHHLDLIHHVIETVRQVELQYDEVCCASDKCYTPTSSSNDRNLQESAQNSTDIKEHLESVDFGGHPRIGYVKLAAFLHDIGKFSCWAIEKDNGKERHRFIKHDIVGAKLVIPMLKELKFSNKEAEYISEMIRYHIYPSGVISAPDLDTKTMMRYIRKMENNVIDNIIIAKADRLSAQGPDITKEMTENNLAGLNKLLKFYIDIKPTLKPLPKLIDGNEIMQILGIKQSPVLGEIISALKEAQICGEVNTREDAVTFVSTYLK